MRILSRIAAMFVRLADYAEVLRKANRLVASGAVTVRHNTPQYVSGHVIGDHNAYNVEIDRTHFDKQGRPFWVCQCPWWQYSFDRSEGFKHLEGRKCSHALALEFQAQRTPLDEGSYDPLDPSTRPRFQRIREYDDNEMWEQIQQAEKNRRLREERGLDTGKDIDTSEYFDQRTFTPEDEPPPNTYNQHGYPNRDPNRWILDPQTVNPFHHVEKQVQRQHWTPADLALPAPGPAAPAQAVPDMAPPDANNPIKFPGAFGGPATPEGPPPPETPPGPKTSSIPPFKVISVVECEQMLTRTSSTDVLAEMDQMLRTPQRVVVVVKNPVHLEQRQGKMPVPGADPIGVDEWGSLRYRTMDLGYHPELGRRINADEGPNGAPEQRGDFVEVPPGYLGEVIDVDPTFKQVLLRTPLKGGALHARYAEAWVNVKDVEPAYDIPSPFRAGYVAPPPSNPRS